MWNVEGTIYKCILGACTGKFHDEVLHRVLRPIPLLLKSLALASDIPQTQTMVEPNVYAVQPQHQQYIVIVHTALEYHPISTPPPPVSSAMQQNTICTQLSSLNSVQRFGNVCFHILSPTVMPANHRMCIFYSRSSFPYIVCVRSSRLYIWRLKCCRPLSPI